jgi:hypothetical protein
MAKRKSAKKRTSKRLPSWREVRAGLMQATKIRLLAVLGRVYLSRATPRSVKLKIISTAKLGVKRVSKRKITRKSRTRKSKSKRTPAQIRATKKLIAFNKRRR